MAASYTGKLFLIFQSLAQDRGLTAQIAHQAGRQALWRIQDRLYQLQRLMRLFRCQLG